MSVQVLPDGTSRVRWRPQGAKGPQLSRDFPPGYEAAALAFDAQFKVRKKAGKLGSLAAAGMRFDALAQQWFVEWAEPNLQAKTKLEYAQQFDRHLLKRVGALPLDRASRPAVWDQLRDDLIRAGVGAATVRKLMGIAQAIFRQAVIWDYVDANPLLSVRKPTAGRKRAILGLAPVWCEVVRIAMRERMVERAHKGSQPLFVAAESAIADALLACLIHYAGLRPGEALGLEWDRVLQQTLVIDQAVSLGEEKGTKNRKNRSVKTLAPLKADLDEYRMFLGRPGSGLVFPRADGKAWFDTDYRNWRGRVWHGVRDELGLARQRPYDGRHSFGSLLLHEGRSLAYVAQQMGDTVETISSTYMHVIDELADTPAQPAEETIRAARSRVSREGVRKVCGDLVAVKAATG